VYGTPVRAVLVGQPKLTGAGGKGPEYVTGVKLMNPFDGFANWIVTEVESPAFSVTTPGSVINGNPLNMPVELVIVTPAVRFVRTTLTGPAIEDPPVFVIVMVAVQRPVARLCANPVWVIWTCDDTSVTSAKAGKAIMAINATLLAREFRFQP
jgi:hypothetical protein